MIVWRIPRKKARIELRAEGWVAVIRSATYSFNTLAECFCFLAGRRIIDIEAIPFLLQKTRERFQ